MVSRLKIFSDKKWLPSDSKHVIMLYPFWGDIPLPDSDPDKDRFDEYLKVGKTIFEIVNSINLCDIIVLPFEYNAEKLSLITEITKQAKVLNKRLIVFYNNDSVQEIKLDNSIILRTSFFKSRQKNNEFAFPGWSSDFKKYIAEIKPLSKNQKPEISYCGYVDSMEEPDLLKRVKSLFNRIEKENVDYGRFIRGKMVRRLFSDNRIKSNFIIRDGFWAQGINDKHKVRKEYTENMFASPYALVTRGAGNFSYRLIEVMSCGRIPVFVNTDAVLPMEMKINWKKQCVWVEENEVDQINDILLRFHTKISANDFIELQRQNRNIYETYLSPVGYFSHLKLLLS